MSLFSELFGGGGGVKSIQRGVITIAGGSSSGTATISSVNTAKSELRFLGWRQSGGGTLASSSFPLFVLTDSTTITATAGAGPNAVAVSWELTEWN